MKIVGACLATFLFAQAPPTAVSADCEQREWTVSELKRAGAIVFAKTNLPAHVVGMGPILQVWFSNKPIHNYRDAARYCDHDMFRRWWEGCLNRGVLFHPGAYENLFVSFAHTEADIEATLAVAREVVKEI